jgi:hypothetical protein
MYKTKSAKYQGRLCGSAMLERWAARFDFRPPRRSSFLLRAAVKFILEWQTVPNSDIGKEPETKAETQANLAVAHGDSVALGELRVVGRVQGSLPRTPRWEEGEDPPFLLSLMIILSPGERDWWVDRNRFRICTCELWCDRIRGWSALRAAPGRFWVEATCWRAGFRHRIRRGSIAGNTPRHTRGEREQG